jgi:hypothetical protein
MTERFRGIFSTLLLGVLIFTLAGGFVTRGPVASAFQEDWSAWLEEPSPDECTVEATSADHVIETIAIAAINPPDDILPGQVDSIEDLPSGKPATAEEAEGAMSALRMAIACFNAGKYGAALAMFSDQGLTQLLLGNEQFQVQSLSMQEIEQLIDLLAPIFDNPATPVPASERARLTEIRDVLLLEDGRILITAVGFTNIGEGLAFFILSEGEDHWEIDAAGSIGPIATPATS